MADKKVKAWAVWSPTKGVREANKRRALSASVSHCLNEAKHAGANDWQAVPCTITLHMPKKKGAER
jgi:hypothetical protein